jgi:non-ribosomal peptide synthetase component F
LRPADMCLHELFEEQARRTSRALAVEDTGTRLTYEELDGKADLLASYLRDAGAGPGELVGVYMERRAEYVVACLAAMKAGAAYLILELAYPPSRLRDVVADSEPRLVLTQERYAGNLPAGRRASAWTRAGKRESRPRRTAPRPPSIGRTWPSYRTRRGPRASRRASPTRIGRRCGRTSGASG